MREAFLFGITLGFGCVRFPLLLDNKAHFPRACFGFSLLKRNFALCFALGSKNGYRRLASQRTRTD